MSGGLRTRPGLCPGLWEPGYCLPGSPAPVTPGSGAHMPALNSPSVSPTILITIPFGQAKKTASTALVLIKKSELAILAAFLSPFRPGMGPDNLITGHQNTSLLPPDPVNTPHPPSNPQQRIRLFHYECICPQQPVTARVTQTHRAREQLCFLKPRGVSRANGGHVHLWLHLLPLPHAPTINKLIDRQSDRLKRCGSLHVIISYTSRTLCLNPQGYPWLRKRIQCSGSMWALLQGSEDR